MFELAISEIRRPGIMLSWLVFPLESNLIHAKSLRVEGLGFIRKLPLHSRNFSSLQFRHILNFPKSTKDNHLAIALVPHYYILPCCEIPVCPGSLTVPSHSLNGYYNDCPTNSADFADSRKGYRRRRSYSGSEPRRIPKCAYAHSFGGEAADKRGHGSSKAAEES